MSIHIQLATENENILNVNVIHINGQRRLISDDTISWDFEFESLFAGPSAVLVKSLFPLRDESFADVAMVASMNVEEWEIPDEAETRLQELISRSISEGELEIPDEEMEVDIRAVNVSRRSMDSMDIDSYPFDSPMRPPTPH